MCVWSSTRPWSRWSREGRGRALDCEPDARRDPNRLAFELRADQQIVMAQACGRRHARRGRRRAHHGLAASSDCLRSRTARAVWRRNSIATHPKPIEITTPALRNLKISGVFATDDPEAFIAFLRSLKGVRVEVTETRIRVS